MVSLTTSQAAVYEFLLKQPKKYNPAKYGTTEKVVHVTGSEIIIAIGGSTSKIFCHIDMLERHGLINVVRTGGSNKYIVRKKPYRVFNPRSVPASNAKELAESNDAQRVLDLINKNATERGFSNKMPYRLIAAATGIEFQRVGKIVRALKSTGKVVVANCLNNSGRGRVSSYDQSHEIPVVIDGKRALIRGKFTVSFNPEGA